MLGYDLRQMVAAFKSDFIDGVDGGATQTVTPPACGNETAARADGYHIASSSGDTVYWCFGEDSTGRRLLKVTDHRRYPLEVQHPNMDVIADGFDWAQLASLSRFDSGNRAIIAPGGTAEFDADLSPGGTEGIQTELDGLGQSLYALQTGVTTLVEILTRFGAGGGRVADAADKLLRIPSCGGAIGKGSGALIAGCFSAKDILDAFGWKGLLLAPIVIAGPVIAFFHEEWNGLVDQFNGHSVYRIVISRDKAPAAKLLTLRPVTATGTAAAGWTVDTSRDNPAAPIQCSISGAVYPSPSAVSAGIYACAPFAEQADTCWPAAAPTKMLCLANPRTDTLEQLTADAQPGPVQPSTHPVPIELDLADGDHCRLRNGGAWPSPPSGELPEHTTGELRRRRHLRESDRSERWSAPHERAISTGLSAGYPLDESSLLPRSASIFTTRTPPGTRRARSQPTIPH